MVYSANFYADPRPEHEKRFYTDDLMVMAYPLAAELAAKSAEADSENFRRRLGFRTQSTAIGEPADNTHSHALTACRRAQRMCPAVRRSIAPPNRRSAPRDAHSRRMTT